MRLLKILILGISLVFGLQAAPGEPPKKMVKELELTPRQQRQMQVQWNSQMKSVKSNIERVRQLHEQLDKEFLKERPNEKKIAEIVTEIKKVQVILIDKHFEGLFVLRQILTPEQFRKMIKSRKERENFVKRFRHKSFPDMPKGGEPPLLP